MHRNKIHFHLNTIIIALAILIVVFPVMLVGILTSQIAKNYIQDEVKAITREFVEQQYVNLIQAQKQAEGNLVTLEDNQQIKDYLFSSSSENNIQKNITQAQLENILNRITINGWIDSIDVINLDGKVVTSRAAYTPSLSPDEIKYYLSQTQNNSKGIYYEGIKQTASQTTPDISRVSIVKLVRNKDIEDPLHQPVGFIIINLSTNNIFEDLSLYRFGDGSQLTIIDQSQRIIFSYDKSSIGGKLPSEINIELKNNFGNPTTEIDNESSYLIYYKLVPSDWTILLTTPTASVEGRTRGIYNSVGAILAGTVLFSIIIMIIAASLLVRPTNQIVNSMIKMRNGTFDWEKRFKGSPITEIDELIHWFNAFIENEVGEQSIKQALHDSESRYKILFENSPVALWEEDFSPVINGLEKIGFQGERLRKYLEDHSNVVIDLMSRLIILDVNQATLQLYGIKDKDDLLKNAAQLFSNVSHEQLVVELMAMSVKTPKFENIVNNCRADGKIIHVRVRWSVYPGHEAQMSRVIVNTVDITQQIQANAVQDAIYRISQAASTTENLQELYQSIHKILGELMPAKNFYIALYDGNEGMINFPYHVDEMDPPPEARKFGNGWTEYVIRTGEPMLLSPENLDKLEEDEGVKTVGSDSIDWLGVPLKVEDRVIGMLAVQTYTEGVRYTEVEKGILVFVSSQIAMAIERKRTEEKLKYSSTHEPLTGLYNRAYYEEEIKRLNSGRQAPVGAIVIDIDGLKIINDNYGHAAGDELLKAFAIVLQKEFRSNDVVARIGGDEFGVLLPLSPMKIVKKAVDRTQKSVDKYNELNPQIHLSYSVGYFTTEDGDSVLDAIKQADALMYQDKASKKASRAA